MRQLPDGNWLLKLDGLEVQTLRIEEKRAIIKAQIELDGLRQEVALLKQQVEHYEVIKAMFEQERANGDKQVEALKASIALLEKQVVESREMLSLILKQTKRNKIEQALSNPFLTLAFKIGVPLVNVVGGWLR